MNTADSSEKHRSHPEALSAELTMTVASARLGILQLCKRRNCTP